MSGDQTVFTVKEAEKKIRWETVRAAVFDVDGTLYHQRPVRMQMAARLAGYYAAHPLRLRELRGISAFRKLREEEAFRTVSLTGQIQEAARRSGVRDAERLEKAIQRWMFREPLKMIAAHPKKEVLSLLHRLRAEGKRIVIYSDYAAEKKLEALGVVPDAVYYPGIAGVKELKPSRHSMNLILEREGLRPDQAVMVGDRMEKDGRSAELVGMRFVFAG